MDKPPLVFFSIVALVFVINITYVIVRKWKLAARSVVREGQNYPNNFHVLGVGFYHAADHAWFTSAWNEYRENRGYFWGGKWNLTPDSRTALKSVPPQIEIDRVNKAWREADPDRAADFWNKVEREGFGVAMMRSGG